MIVSSQSLSSFIQTCGLSMINSGQIVENTAAQNNITNGVDNLT